MRIGVIGINHKQADLLPLRELLAKICQKRFGPGYCLHVEHTFVPLLTCNRTEIYFSSQDLSGSHSYILDILKNDISCEFDQNLYSFFNQQCFNHLVTVATGLDSAIVAETEIQRQVRQAYETTFHYTKLTSDLHYAFQKALKISKDIRSKFNFGRGLPNLEHAIYQTSSQFFHTPEETSILFIGGSEINQKVLQYLRKKGCDRITLSNRSDKNAEKLSMKLKVPLLPWEQLDKWRDFDWIILGTKAPGYLIQADQLKYALNRQKLILDLSFPRNADPILAEKTHIKLLNIDEINQMLKFRRKALYQTIIEAQKEIQQCVEKYSNLFYMKKSRFRSRSSLVA